MRRLVLLVLVALSIGLIVAVSAAQVNVESVIKKAESAEAAVDKPKQTAAAPVFDSPRATMSAFLEAMNEVWHSHGAWDRAIATMDLSQAETPDGKKLARKLYDILNRIEYVDVDKLPGPEQVAAQKLEYCQYFPSYPRDDFIKEKVGRPVGKIVIAPTQATGSWQFTAETVSRIGALFKQMEPLPQVAGRQYLTLGDWIEARLPRSLTRDDFLTLKYWQWIAIFLVILIGLLLDQFVRLVVRLVIGRFIRGEKITDEQKETIRLALRPFGYLAASLFWLLTLQFVGLTGVAYTVLDGALTLFVTAAAALAAWRTVDLIAEYIIVRAQNTSTKVDDVLVPLLRKTVKVFIVVMGVIYACNALEIPIGPLLASFGIAGVAFSFAAKDTVENFFGSIAVLLDRPFDVGDWVVIDDVEGIVEEVGFRSTRIRTFYNSQVSIPNSNLVRAKVDNYGRRTYRRWKTYLGVQYDTTPDQLLAFCEGIRELIRTHPYTRKDYYQVYCNEFANSSLNILLYMFFEVPDWNTELRERDRLFLDIVRLADQLGVQFAFPTTTVHLYKEEHGESKSEYVPPKSMTERRAMVRGIKAAHELTENQPWAKEKPAPVVITGTRTDIAYDDAGNPIEEEEDDKKEDR